MQAATDSMFCDVSGKGFESDHGEGEKVWVRKYLARILKNE